MIRRRKPHEVIFMAALALFVCIIVGAAVLSFVGLLFSCLAKIFG